jgi:glycine cleavage system H lipoate-binding protein
MAEYIFLGAFFSVLTVVSVTLLFALWRSRRPKKQEAHLRWHSDFHELPSSDRSCRHALTGEFQKRECPNAFDCRGCQTHPKLKQAALGRAEEEVYGMAFPLDRYYHRGHTWARVEADGAVTVGLDELGKRLVGAPDAVDLPAPGVRVHANGTAFRVKRRETDVRILSPVDGEVVETGGPDREWYLKVRPENTNFTHLLRGEEIRPWMLREIERLQLALSAEGAPTLADGGVPVADIPASCPGADWDAVCGEMFLAP